MSFCEHCVDLHELPGSPSGSETKVEGVATYVAKGSSDKGAVVVATDIFGLGIPNAKQVADTLAKESGLTVYVPDYFPTGPMKPEQFELPKTAAAGPPSEEQGKKNFDNFGQWMGNKNDPSHTYPLFQAVADHAKKTHGKVGGVGFCYGGKIVALGAQDGTLDAGAIFHPAMLEPEEADKVRVPILLNQAELDPLFAGELKEAWNQTLTKNNKLDQRSKTYPNTVHGFGSRPDLKDAQVKAGHEEAIANTAAFFKETLA